MNKKIDKKPVIRWVLWGVLLFLIIQISGVIAFFLPTPINIVLVLAGTILGSLFVGYKGTETMLPTLKNTHSTVNPLIYGACEAMIAGLLAMLLSSLMAGKLSGSAIPLIPLIFCAIGGHLATRKSKK